MASRYDSEDWQRKLSTQLIEGIRNRLDFIGAKWSSSAGGHGGDQIRLLDYACGTGMITRVSFICPVFYCSRFSSRVLLHDTIRGGLGESTGGLSCEEDR